MTNYSSLTLSLLLNHPDIVLTICDFLCHWPFTLLNTDTHTQRDTERERERERERCWCCLTIKPNTPKDVSGILYYGWGLLDYMLNCPHVGTLLTSVIWDQAKVCNEAINSLYSSILCLSVEDSECSHKLLKCVYHHLYQRHTHTHNQQIVIGNVAQQYLE